MAISGLNIVIISYVTHTSHIACTVHAKEILQYMDVIMMKYYLASDMYAKERWLYLDLTIYGLNMLISYMTYVC